MRKSIYIVLYLILLGSIPKVMAQSAPKFEMIITLKAQANLNLVNLVTDRATRLKMIYSELVKTARTSQMGINSLLNQRGYQTRSFYINNTILVLNADLNLANEIYRRPDVLKIAYNTKFRMKQLPRVTEATSPSIRGIEKSLTVIKADQVWNQFKIQGRGIVIAGQDTGIQWDHPAIIRQYRGSTSRGVIHDYNWHDAITKAENPKGSNRCGYGLKTPCDDNGHGTHTIGTIVGSDGANNQIGVAPQAQWIGCRNMDEGFGTIASYTECFEFFLAPYLRGGDPQIHGRPELAPHVINNSWGCTTSEGCKGDEFVDVLKVLKQAGIMVVVSAGNDGSSCGSINAPPANHTGLVWSVGAINNSMSIANFSSRGPSKFDGGIGPDIVAPGVAIRSADLKNSYASLSGTSMAGPHMVGAVALLWSANPKFIGRVEETESIFRKTATPLKSRQVCGGVAGDAIPNNTFGFGMVNTLSAVQAVMTR